jgi:hypothetical protein
MSSWLRSRCTISPSPPPHPEGGTASGGAGEAGGRDPGVHLEMIAGPPPFPSPPPRPFYLLASEFHIKGITCCTSNNVFPFTITLNVHSVQMYTYLLHVQDRGCNNKRCLFFAD